MAEHISKNQDIQLRGSGDGTGGQQQPTRRLRALLYEGPSYKHYPNLALQAQFAGNTTPISLLPTDLNREPSQPGLRLQSFELYNGDAASIVAGIGFRWMNTYWKVADWDDSATTASVILNATYQTSGATTFMSGIGTPADQDAILIYADAPFNWISMNVTTASINAGASDADIDYSALGGASWVTNTALQTHLDTLTIAAGELTVGEKILAWATPHDWTPVELGSVLNIAGIPVGKYALLYRWSDVPTTDAVVQGIEIGSMKFSGLGLVTTGLFENERIAWTDHRADGVVALFSTADPANTVAFEAAPAG